MQSLVLYVLTPVGGAEGAARELRGSPLAETPGNETNLRGESLPMEAGKPLYGGTGFPQRVQGKRGENYGESRTATKVSVFRWLGCFEVEKTGTRKNVWT